MPGKVFISCGQRPPDETRIATTIKNILKTDFGLDSYLAFKIQSLGDIMTITNELRSSDYYLFIDFVRRPANTYDLPVSLFTHQELSLAHHIGFRDIIALQQDKAPIEGFLRYVLSNPEHFTDEADLYAKVRTLVASRGWSNAFSRNLVLDNLGFSMPFQYTDHSGSFIVCVYQVRAMNKRPDTAATGTVCILDYYVRMSDGARFDSPDRSYLKWAGQAGYDRTILPTDYGDIDVLSVHADRLGIFLHSLRDTPREPIIDANGVYQLHFKLYSRDFQLTEFVVEVNLRWTAPTPPIWSNPSTAKLM
jgi:hypothetical protein